MATGNEGETVPVVKWMHDEVEVTETDLSARVHTVTSDKYHQLKLMKIKETDAGAYKCEGEVGVDTASDLIELIVLVKLEVTSPTEQFGILGETKVVECEHKGKPAPTVTWKFANQSEIKDVERFSKLTNGLEISDLEKSDEMTYICELMTLSTGDTYIHEVNFAVVAKPSINEMLSIEPANAVVGSEVKITCNAEGDPAPAYQFLKGEGEILVEDGVEGNILTIPSVTVDDQAKYTCVATNKGGMDKKDTMLDVLVSPTIEIAQEVYEVGAGDALDIPCVVKGDPQPSIVWTKVQPTTSDGTDVDGWSMVEGTTTGDDKDVKVVTSSLSIPTVEYKHNGTYMCQGTNSIGNVEKTITVIVEYKPNFDTEINKANTEFWGWEGHNAVLQCQANANPAVAEINWKMQDADGNKMDVPVDAGTYAIESFETDKHLSTSKLSVMIGADSAVYTDYFCEAINIRSEGVPASHTVVLKAAKAPEMPTLKQGDILSMSTVILANEPAENGGQPIKQFEYETTIMEDYETTTDDSAVGTTETVDSEGIDAETKIEVRSLTPGTSYKVKVRAINNVGAGSWAEMTFVTVNVSKPERMSFKSNDGGEMSSYTLEWEAIATGGNKVTQIDITWQEVTLETDGSVVNVVGELMEKVISSEELDQNSFSIPDLKPDTDYQIRAFSTNGIGSSDTENINIKTAAAAKPQTEASSASLGSGSIIAIILVLIAVVAIIVIVVFFIAKRKPELLGKLRKGGNRGEEEGLKKGGKDQAEEEKLIQKEDTVKVENEVEEVKQPVAETKPQEFEPETKPEAPAPVVPVVEIVDVEEEEKPDVDDAAVPVTEIKVTPETPETPEKPENPTA